jgi:hypothetical protein
MKKIIVLALGLLAGAGVFAQSADGGIQNEQTSINPAARAQENTDKINAVAQLTQDQYSKVLQINHNFYNQIRTVGAGRSARLVAWRNQQIQAAVNPDQFQKIQSAGLLQE